MDCFEWRSARSSFCLSNRKTQNEFIIFAVVSTKSMRFRISIVLLLACNFQVFAQAKMDKTLKKFNKGSIPYIQVNALHGMNHVMLLDTRKREEYEVSHLKNARWVGFKTFELDSVTSTIKDRNTAIVVYCSIGVRSENIGEKLKEAGYSNVKNLYGGIFEWKNAGFPVYDLTGKETEKVHAFSKHWGRLLKKGEKVFGPEEDSRQSQ